MKIKIRRLFSSFKKSAKPHFGLYSCISGGQQGNLLTRNFLTCVSIR